MRQFEKLGSVQTLARQMPADDLRVFELIFPAENTDHQCLGTYRIRANFMHLFNFEFLNSHDYIASNLYFKLSPTSRTHGRLIPSHIQQIQYIYREIYGVDAVIRVSSTGARAHKSCTRITSYYRARTVGRDSFYQFIQNKQHVYGSLIDFLEIPLSVNGEKMTHFFAIADIFAVDQITKFGHLIRLNTNVMLEDQFLFPVSHIVTNCVSVGSDKGPNYIDITPVVAS